MVLSSTINIHILTEEPEESNNVNKVLNLFHVCLQKMLVVLDGVVPEQRTFNTLSLALRNELTSNTFSFLV